jgi:hypothetical protein
MTMPTSSSKRLLLIIAAILLGIALVAGLTGWLVWRRTMRTIERFTKRSEQTVDISQVVTRVQDLARLETAAMRVMHVATTSQSYELIPNAIAGDEITLVSTGDVIAGVDLSQLRQQDIRRDLDGTLVIKLPPPQILITRLDNRQTKVISRKTGFFRRADSGMEGRARDYAERQIRDEAVRRGILQTAGRNAETKVGAFVRTLGAQRVRFEETVSPAETPR